MENNNCICSDSNYCINSFDEFVKCKNYKSFQNLHPMIRLINNQDSDHSEIKLNFQGNRLNLQGDKTIIDYYNTKLIKLLLDTCTKIENEKKKIMSMIIFELIFNNLKLVKTNKNFENIVRKKIHTFIKESFNEFEDLSKYNNNINPILTIKRLFDLYFPEK
jgi:hypothetical protein